MHNRKTMSVLPNHRLCATTNTPNHGGGAKRVSIGVIGNRHRLRERLDSYGRGSGGGGGGGARQRWNRRDRRDHAARALDLDRRPRVDAVADFERAVSQQFVFAGHRLQQRDIARRRLITK